MQRGRQHPRTHSLDEVMNRTEMRDVWLFVSADKHAVTAPHTHMADAMCSKRILLGLVNKHAVTAPHTHIQDGCL